MLGWFEVKNQSSLLNELDRSSGLKVAMHEPNHASGLQPTFLHLYEVCESVSFKNGFEFLLLVNLVKDDAVEIVRCKPERLV
jgi:hypothetical protein